jgi:hypothetical protein
MAKYDWGWFGIVVMRHLQSLFKGEHILGLTSVIFSKNIVPVVLASTE